MRRASKTYRHSEGLVFVSGRLEGGCVTHRRAHHDLSNWMEMSVLQVRDEEDM